MLTYREFLTEQSNTKLTLDELVERINTRATGINIPELALFLMGKPNKLLGSYGKEANKKFPSLKNDIYGFFGQLPHNPGDPQMTALFAIVDGEPVMIASVEVCVIQQGTDIKSNSTTKGNIIPHNKSVIHDTIAKDTVGFKLKTNAKGVITGLADEVIPVKGLSKLFSRAQSTTDLKKYIRADFVKRHNERR